MKQSKENRKSACQSAFEERECSSLTCGGRPSWSYWRETLGVRPFKRVDILWTLFFRQPRISSLIAEPWDTSFFYLDEFVKRNCWGRLIVVVDYLLRTALRCLALTSHDRGGRFFSKDEMVDEMTRQMTWKEFWASWSWPADRIWRWLLRRKKLVAPKRHDIS